MSASLNRDFALSWILGNDNPESQTNHLLVLFEIQVVGINNHFYMNSPTYSMYSSEEEVLLSDGLRWKILDI